MSTFLVHHISRTLFILTVFLSIAFPFTVHAFDFESIKLKKPENVYYGFEPGFAILDSDSQFQLNQQNISTDIDNPSLSVFAFIGAPYNEKLGLEIGLGYLGAFDFNASFSGANVGTATGTQSYYGLNGSIFYQKNFGELPAKAHIGFMAMHLQTDGTVKLIGNPDQSMDYSENSSNLFLAFEANKKLNEDWNMAPRLSLINAGDLIQRISIKFSRPLDTSFR